MEHVDLHKMSVTHGGRFRLSSLVAKRMQQLNQEGYRPPSNGQLLSRSLHEVHDGEISLAASAAEAAAQALFKDAKPKESERAPKARRKTKK